MSYDGQLNAGYVRCPKCAADVQTFARVISRDSFGTATIEQNRSFVCKCGKIMSGLTLMGNGLNFYKEPLNA